MNLGDPKRLVPGFMLLILGLVLLALNLGWLQIDLWVLAWRFWPLLLILAGLRLLIKPPLAYLAVAVVLLGGAVWAISYAPESIRSQLGAPDKTAEVQERQEFDEALTGRLDKLTFKLDFGAANINLAALNEADRAYQAVFENAGRINEDIERSSNTMTVELSQAKGQGMFWGGIARRADILLSPNMPLELEIDTGASKQDLDLSGLQLQKLKLDTGASSSTVKLGERASLLDAVVDAGASSLTLQVPASVGLKIIFDSGLTSNNFEVADPVGYPDSRQGQCPGQLDSVS